MGDYIKENAVKTAISQEKQFRITSEAYKMLESSINTLIENIINTAIKNAKEDDRKTIMEKDIQSATDKEIAKKDLNYEEILEQILNESAADLGKITTGINKYIENA